MEPLSDRYMGVGFPKSSFPEISWLTIYSRVIEVNVGIICSCLLAFPAFLNHYELHGFDFFVSKLISLLSSRRRETNSGTDQFRRRYLTSWPWTSRSGHVSSEEYNELNGNTNAIKMQNV